MAIMQCPECGKDVSTMAATCPHCGYPLAAPASAPLPPPAVFVPPPPPKGTSGATVIGWIVIIVVCALVLHSCIKAAGRVADGAVPDGGYSAAAYSAPDSPAKTYSVKVIDSGCEAMSGRYTKVRTTVENTGTSTIPFAKAYFEVYGKDGKIMEAKDTYFSPTDIPPGARASADTMFTGDVDRCALVRIQATDGTTVAMQ